MLPSALSAAFTGVSRLKYSLYLFAHPFQPCLCIIYCFRTGRPRTCAHKVMKQWHFPCFSRKQAAAVLSVKQVQEAAMNGVKHFHLASGRPVFKRGRGHAEGSMAGDFETGGAYFCFTWAVRRRLWWDCWWGQEERLYFLWGAEHWRGKLTAFLGEPLFLFCK